MAQWEGYGVSVRCGSPLGCYQGTILAADGASITLTKPFRNGFPYPKAQVTLKVSDIKSLEIISGKTSTDTAHSTVPVVSKKRAPRATVGESLLEQAPLPAPVPAPLPASAPAPPPPLPAARGKPARSKPIDIQARPAKSITHAGSYGASGSTPKSRATGDKARRRNEACFGSAALEEVDNDFDFEGNLALFDKEALWQQMRPDVVRVAAAREEMAAGGKMRHDQNVLRGSAPDTAPVSVPAALRGARDYVTDAGARLPGAAAALRAGLWAGLRRMDEETQHAARTLLARAAADVALKLVGGTRRLDPRNAHQRPVAGACAGAGAGAAAAVCAARLLRSHGVDTYVVALDESCPLVSGALAAYRACGGLVLTATEPRPAGDLLLLAVHDPQTTVQHHRVPQVLEWAVRSRGALVVLEPGGDPGWARALAAARAVLVALLPPALAAPAPRLLLANVAPPPQLFSAMGVTYRSPFGASSVLALHLADDDD